GLMQVVPKTAGRDVFKLVKNRAGEPTPEYLFNPENNIDTGTAYCYILKNRYLRDVRNPTSLEYSMISAYNGGTGGVLNTFSRDRQRAMRDLNALQPNQVYWALTKKHPNAESRRYLEKVTQFKKEFNAG
ncbi:transglycosylase SLT domain-containing protein, partial [Vibrio parahaemolyticus]|uniref:transglycosylase SLT domain-containing protein n=1 Tax=Vibrio parahaemolyticus TaxID=670 RepID=UPI001EEC1704